MWLQVATNGVRQHNTYINSLNALRFLPTAQTFAMSSELSYMNWSLCRRCRLIHCAVGTECLPIRRTAAQTQQLLPAACSNNPLPISPSLSDPLPPNQPFFTEGLSGYRHHSRTSSLAVVSYQPHFRTSLSLSLSLSLSSYNLQCQESSSSALAIVTRKEANLNYNKDAIRTSQRTKCAI